MPTAPRTLRYRKANRMPERRGNAHQRGYTRQWEKASAAWLKQQFAQGNVYCAGCGGLLNGSRSDIHVDHIIDHKGDMELFWDSENNWAAMHPRCHAKKTRRENRRIEN